MRPSRGMLGLLDGFLAGHVDDLHEANTWERGAQPREPLAEYARYALALIPMEMSDGSELFLVDRDVHPDLATLTEDFWMFDERRVAGMRYDEQERFVEAADPTEPIETYAARRDLALKHAARFTTGWPSIRTC